MDSFTPGECCSLGPIRSRVRSHITFCPLCIYGPSSVRLTLGTLGFPGHKFLWVWQAWEAGSQELPTSSRKLKKHTHPQVMMGPNPWTRPEKYTPKTWPLTDIPVVMAWNHEGSFNNFTKFVNVNTNLELMEHFCHTKASTAYDRYSGWEIVTWYGEFDEFIVYQTTNNYALFLMPYWLLYENTITCTKPEMT